MTDTKNKGRQHIFSLTGCALTHILLILLTVLPAFFISCSDSEALSCGKSETVLSMYPATAGDGLIADIFVFNDDALGRLDSYQRIRIEPGKIPSAASRKGDKIIVAVLNPHTDKYGYRHIASYDAFLSERIFLKNEKEGSLLMSGTGRVSAGSAAECRIDVVPMASEISLRSLKCDFSSRPYAGECLEDVKVYLTNVNTEAGILQRERFLPENICNLAGYRKSDMQDFLSPGILSKSIDAPVGSGTVYPYISLYCYPNTAEEESAGSPFTRLVIEGKIKGKTCFYPIDINRTVSGKGGIERNCRYVYDITIKSAGTSDPDIPVKEEDTDINLQIVPWTEKESRPELF